MRARVLVVVPAFDEQGVVGDTVREVRSHLGGVEVLVVDDGSRDGTRAEALAAGARVVSLPYNLGVGGAVRTGLRFALRHGFDVVVQVDADGQHDPADVPRLVEGLDAADLVVGARFAGEGSYEVAAGRRVAMRALAGLASRVVGTRMTDVTSGFRAFGPRAVVLLAEEMPPDYLGDTVDAMVVAARAGLTVQQVPVAMRPRRGGTASQSSVAAGRHVARAAIALAVAAARRGAQRAPAGAATVDGPARGSGEPDRDATRDAPMEVQL